MFAILRAHRICRAVMRLYTSRQYGVLPQSDSGRPHAAATPAVAQQSTAQARKSAGQGEAETDSCMV